MRAVLLFFQGRGFLLPLASFPFLLPTGGSVISRRIGDEVHWSPLPKVSAKPRFWCPPCEFTPPLVGAPSLLGT